jgi:hypothetical protein
MNFGVNGEQLKPRNIASLKRGRSLHPLKRHKVPPALTSRLKLSLAYSK